MNALPLDVFNKGLQTNIWCRLFFYYIYLCFHGDSSPTGILLRGLLYIFVEKLNPWEFQHTIQLVLPSFEIHTVADADNRCIIFSVHTAVKRFLKLLAILGDNISVILMS